MAVSQSHQRFILLSTCSLIDRTRALIFHLIKNQHHMTPVFKQGQQTNEHTLNVGDTTGGGRDAGCVSTGPSLTPFKGQSCGRSASEGKLGEMEPVGAETFQTARVPRFLPFVSKVTAGHTVSGNRNLTTSGIIGRGLQGSTASLPIPLL